MSPRSCAASLAAAVLLLVTPATPTLACVGGHWVDTLSDDGTTVTLEDGSVWAIDDGDEVDTTLWRPNTGVVACSDRLLNTDNRHVASAHRVR
jgi:hypothetical protein